VYACWSVFAERVRHKKCPTCLSSEENVLAGNYARVPIVSGAAMGALLWDAAGNATRSLRRIRRAILGHRYPA
jgi:hypothetical protein